MVRNLTKWLLIVAVLAMYWLGSQVTYGQEAEQAQAAGWEFAGLTDIGTSMAEFRVGRVLDETWTVGALAEWFPEDAENPSEDWAAGAYVKLAVDPNASMPVANWFPRVGDWLQLPETLTAETYLIGKGRVLPYEDGVDFALSFGGGAQVGPVFGEVVYDIVESGDADNPVTASGMTIWLGLCLEF